MPHPYIVAFAVIAVAAGYVILPFVVDAWLSVRGRRQVACPELGGAVAFVRLDALRAAIASPIHGGARPHVAHCSRWKEGARCAERCVGQIV